MPTVQHAPSCSAPTLWPPPVTALSAAAQGVGGKVRQRLRTNADLRRGGGRATLTAVAPSGERGASCYLMTAAKWGGRAGGEGLVDQGSWIRRRRRRRKRTLTVRVSILSHRALATTRGRDRKPCSSLSRRRAARPSMIWGLTSARRDTLNTTTWRRASPSIDSYVFSDQRASTNSATHTARLPGVGRAEESHAGKAQALIKKRIPLIILHRESQCNPKLGLND